MSENKPLTSSHRAQRCPSDGSYTFRCTKEQPQIVKVTVYTDSNKRIMKSNKTPLRYSLSLLIYMAFCLKLEEIEIA